MLKTSAFTLYLTALTPKTQRSLPSRPPSSPMTMLLVVSSARLHQVSYEIFAKAATNAAGRRPSGHLLTALILKMRCPSLDSLPLGVAGVCPAIPIHRI